MNSKANHSRAEAESATGPFRKKRCSICGELKALKEFHRRRHYMRSGRRSACIECTRQQTLEYRTKKPQIADPQKNRVRVRTRAAIKRGELVPLPCSVCGNVNVEPHHLDYRAEDAHLRVLWLCKKHHSQIHGKRDWTKQAELFPDPL